MGIAAHTQGELEHACNLYEQALRQQAVQLQTIEQQIHYRPLVSQRVETLLFEALTGLHRLGIAAFMTGGNLLGLTRDGGILPADKDIDIVLPMDQISAAGNWLAQQGWQRVIHMPQLINPVAWQHGSGIPLELVGYLPYQDHVISGFWFESADHPWSRITHIPRVTLVERAHPLGAYWHPNDPGALLDVIFGKDWRIPNPNYDSLLHSPSVHDFSLVTRCYALKRIYWHWVTQAFDKASALVEKCISYNSADTFFLLLFDAIQIHRDRLMLSPGRNDGCQTTGQEL